MEYSLKDIDKALAVVDELQAGARGKTVALPTFVLELAGMMELADRAGLSLCPCAKFAEQFGDV